MSLLKLRLIFLNGMCHFASHERIRCLIEDAQTGTCAKIDSLALINGAGIIHGVFEFASTGSFVFG
jgi:hypothetical protein